MRIGVGGKFGHWTILSIDDRRVLVQCICGKTRALLIENTEDWHVGLSGLGLTTHRSTALVLTREPADNTDTRNSQRRQACAVQTASGNKKHCQQDSARRRYAWTRRLRHLVAGSRTRRGKGDCRLIRETARDFCAEALASASMVSKTRKWHPVCGLPLMLAERRRHSRSGAS
jgi:hypothetical protein